MKKWIIVGMIQLVVMAAIAQDKKNQRDSQQRKQGYWMEVVGEIRGEPGYTWEGVYKDNQKEGVWKRTAVSGQLLSEETYHHDVLSGYCRYYFPNGKPSSEGMYVMDEITGQKDTVVVIDPVNNAERRVQVVREGSSVKHGLWKVYDEETGRMMKEYYKRGEPVSAEDAGVVTDTVAPVRKQESLQLPHTQSGKKKKG